MDERRFHLPDQQNYFISHSAMEKLLRRADGNATLVYLYILEQQGKFSLQGVMETLRLSEQAVYDAVSVLKTLGLVSGGMDKAPAKSQAAPEREERSEYSAAEIEREIQTDSAFGALVKEMSSLLGKIPTAADLNILMGIYRDLGLPPDVIYQLISHLTKEHRAKYGAGKSPTLRGIEKIAYIWARNEINTLDRAMAHIERREQQQSAIGQMKKVMDIKQDKLTETQEKYIYSWLDMGFEAEVIAIAYDKTVVQAGRMNWNYMHAILKDWHEKKLHTPDAISEAAGARSPKKQAKTQAPLAPDRDEIARRRKLLDQMGNES